MKFKIAAVLLFIVGTSNSQIDTNFLKVGEIAPRIIGTDQFNRFIDSDKILLKQKIVLLFYRGSWCPYCKKHLQTLQESLEKLTRKGIYVVVVTPEKLERIKESSSNWKTTFSIIHDNNNTIMNQYKVAFDVNSANVPSYFEFTLKKVALYNEENNNNVLPVPATYLINRSKKIEYVHYNSDYSKRASLTEIINLVN